MIRVGLVVPDFGNPFFALLAQIVARELLNYGGACMAVSSEGDSVGEEDALEVLHASSVDGLLVVPVTRDLQAAEFRSNGFPPIVALDRAVMTEGIDCVKGDNEAGMKSIVGHLHGLEHRSFGFIAGPPDTASAEERRHGFFDECKRLRCEPDGDDIFDGDFTFGAGSRAAERLLNRDPETWPTAIVAANDLMAVGLMRKLEEKGRKVPDEISVAGFDDMPLAGALSPGLTTVRQNVRQIAAVGTRLLANRIDRAKAGMEPQEPVQKVIEPELVWRGSTRRPKVNQDVMLESGRS
jgi:LacI family transcriptional regulator